MIDDDRASSLELTHVLAKVDNGIGELCFNRTEFANSCNTEFMRDVVAASDWFNQFDQLKAVMVHGHGKAFCAGYDLKEFTESSPEFIRYSASQGLAMCQSLMNIKAITIAAIHGACVGGGIVLAAACDLRYAASNTRIFLPEIDLGVPLVWGGMPWLVAELGAAAAMEATVLCQPISADYLHQKGFFNGVYEPEILKQSVVDITNTIGKKSALALRATKQQIIAAKTMSAPSNYSFNDANLFYTALLDEESSNLRNTYIAKHTRK